MRRGLYCLLLSLALYAPDRAAANPQDGSIVAGQAAIEQTGPGHLTIRQSSDKAIIDWRGFSIGADERTEFVQPSASALTVNRVTGSQASTIMGQLSANGQIMLINPNGILFGAGSRVDVAGLLATTIDIPNQRLLSDDFRFDLPGNPGATVINRGTITVAEGGLAALVAPGVANSGLIRARLGRIALSSGEAFTLDFYGDGLVEVQVPTTAAIALHDETGAPLPALTSNSGRIEADGGSVLLSARTMTNVIDSAINMDGVVQARSVAQINGEIVLDGGASNIVRVAGTLDASGAESGQTGGRVAVLGDRVGLFDGAHIDAAGSAGGGGVLVGGNYQGSGPEANASRTYVAEGARISAQATDSGNGGRVIVWADEATRYYGQIDVSAGSADGDGGFAEVSGKETLEFAGQVDLSAGHGDAGTLLLDPANIVVQNAGGAAATDVDAFADNAGTTQTIAPATLVAVAGNVTLQATNNITFSDTLALTAAGASLTVEAQNNIAVNAAVSTNNGAISFSAVDMELSSTVNSGSATTTLSNPNGGHTIGLGVTTGHTLHLTNAELQNIATTGGLIIGDATNTASITIGSDIVPGSGGGANVTSLRLNTAGAVTATAGGIVETSLAISAGGNLAFTDTTTDVDNFAASAPGLSVAFRDADDLNIASVAGINGVTTTNFALTTGGGLTDSAPITAVNLGINAGGTITLDDITTDIDDLAVSAAGQTVSIRDVDDVRTDTVGGSVGITATTFILTAGSVTDLQPITATNLAITSSGTVTLDVATTDVDVLAISAAGQSVSFRDADGVDLGHVGTLNGVTAGTFALTAGGAVTDSQASAVTNLGITGTAGITLDVAGNDFDTVAISAAGQSVSVRDTDGLDIGSVGGINGITATTVALTTGGALTDSQVITATNLVLTATGTVTLDTATSDVDTLAVSAAGQSVSFRDADGIDIGSVGGINGATATTFVLTAGGAVTDSQAVAVTNFGVSATGTVTFDVAAFDVDALAISAAGQSVTVTDTDGIDIGSAGSIAGVTATTFTLTAGGAVTDSQAVTATGFALTASGTVTLDTATSDVDTLAVSAAGQSVSFRDADGIDIGTVGAINGVTATTLALTAGGAVTDSHAIAVTNLGLSAGGSVTIDRAGFDIDTLAVSAAGQSVTITDSDGIDFGSVGGINGITATTFTLTAGGTVTDSQALAVTNLALTTTGTVTLDTATNDFDVLAISAAGQSISVRDADSLDIGGVGAVHGLTATTIALTTGGALTDSQAITATNLAVTATGSVTLDMATSDVDTLAVSAAGQSVSFRDADGIDIGNVGGLNGVSATTFALTAGGHVTDSRAIVATNLSLSAAGTVTLDTATNDVDILAVSAAGQTVSIRDSDGIDFGSVGAMNGISATTFALTAGGPVTDSQAVSATNVALTAQGAITLDNAGNDIDTLAISAAGQSVTLVDRDDIAIGTVSGVHGLTAAAVTLTTGGSASGSDALSVASLKLATQSTNLSGTVGGLTGAAAASAITTQAPFGSGTHLFNGSTITATHIATQSTTTPTATTSGTSSTATISTQTVPQGMRSLATSIGDFIGDRQAAPAAAVDIGGLHDSGSSTASAATGAVPSSPREAAFDQGGGNRSYGQNVFESEYPLVRFSDDAGQVYGEVPELGGQIWRRSGIDGGTDAAARHLDDSQEARAGALPTDIASAR